MKKILSILILGLLSGWAYAQDSPPSIFSSGIEGCYSNYYISFHERGAFEVPDGDHEAVLVVINNGRSECYMVKTHVEGGKIIAPLYILKEDGTYVVASKMFKALSQEWLDTQNPDTLYAITDGMSSLFKTQDDFWIRLFFHSFIQPDHGGNKKAPSASELL